MNKPSLPDKIRRQIGDDQVSRNQFYNLLIYHLKIRNWSDYSTIDWIPSSPPENPTSILITELSSIGDVTVTLPLVQSIADRWPRAEVDFLCEAECSVSVKGHPGITKLWQLPVKRWRKWINNEEVDRAKQQLRDRVNRIKQRRYDYVVNPHWNPFPALLNWFLAPDVVNGLTINGRLKASMVGNPTRKMDLEQKTTSNKITVPLNPASSKRLNASVHGGGNHFYQRTDPGEKGKVTEMFEEQVDRNRLHVLINTGSRMEGRRWSSSHCSDVIQYLAEQLSVEFGLIGGPEDGPRLRRVMEQLPESVEIVPWFERTNSLMEDAYLADLADLTITTDSGPQHVISIRGNKVLTLAGDIWVGPWNSSSLVVRHQNGRVDALEEADVLKGVKNVLNGEKISGDQSSAQFFRSPLPQADFWFRNVGLTKQSESDFRSWLSGLLSLQLWSYESKKQGWRSLEIDRDSFQRIYETFWDRDFQMDDPSALSIIGASHLSSSVKDRVSDILNRWSSNG